MSDDNQLRGKVEDRALADIPEPFTGDYPIVVEGLRNAFGEWGRSAAYPSTNPVHPADIAATIYHCLGIDPRAHVTDQQGRPLVVSSGEVVQGLIA